MPTDLLGPLGDEPVPPLAPAAVVRARGEQRSRRRRAALAGATALTLALAGGVGIALGVPSGTDALRPEPYATSGSSDPKPSPAPRPPSPTATQEWFLPDAFLPPEVAAEAELPGWMIQDSHPPDNITSVADPCQEGTLPLADQIRDQGEQAMGSEREAGGSSLLQEVYGYSSSTTAEQAFAEYEQRYTRCASVQDPNASEGWTIRSAVVEDTGARVVVRRIPCSPEGACTEHFSTYAFLVRVADAVTVVAYTIAEDGDPAEEARALAAAVERRLRETVSG